MTSRTDSIPWMSSWMPGDDAFDLPLWRGLLLVVLAYCAARIAGGGSSVSRARHARTSKCHQAAVLLRGAVVMVGGLLGLLLQLHQSGLI